MSFRFTPLILTTISYCLGIIIGDYHRSPVYLPAAVGLFIVYALSSRKIKSAFLPVVLIYLSIIFAGAAYYNYRDSVPPKDISRYVPYSGKLLCSVSGEVMSFPEEIKNGVGFVFKCSRLFVDKDTIEVRGSIKVNLYNTTVEAAGFRDRLKITGTLTLPKVSGNPGAFDYRKYLRHKEIYSVLSSYDSSNVTELNCSKAGKIATFTADFRRQLDRIMTEAMPGAEIETAVLKGIMLGERKSLPQDVQDVFVNSGVVHALSVSGLHVGIVTVIFFGFFRLLRFPERLNYIFTIIIVILYVQVTGSQPPAVRSALMAVSGLIALILDRDRNLFNSIFFAALLMLALSPGTLYDIGFELSFAAVFGLLYFTPFVQELMGYGKVKNKLLKYIISGFAVSIGAQAGVYPIIAYYFNKVSLVSFIANILAVPLSGIIVGLGFLISFLGLVSIPLAMIPGFLNVLVTKLFIAFITACAAIPFAFMYVVSPAPLFFIFYYSFFLMLPYVIKSRKARTILLFCTAAYFLIVITCKLSGYGGLQITFLEMNGNATHIKLPDKTHLLIYGNGAGRRFNSTEKLLCPYLWKKGVNKLEALFITGTHYKDDDKENIEAIIERFKPQKIYCREALGHNGKIVSAGYEEMMGLGRGVNVFVLNPQGCAGENVILKLVSGRFSLLFYGDSDKEKFSGLHPEDLSCEALQVSVSGKKAFPEEFLKKILPKYAIITGKLLNTNELNRLPGTEVFNTQRDGAVTVTVKPAGGITVTGTK